METYRLSSKLRDKEREYLIQTFNDVSLGSVSTAIFVDGVQTETSHSSHPEDMTKEQMLALVKATHGEKKKEMEGLLEAYQQVMQMSDPDSLFQLATAFYYKRLYSEAINLLQGVISLRPEHHAAFNRLNATYLAMGRTEDGIAAGTRAVSLRSEYADYRNNLGEAFLADGMTEQAIEELEAAVSVNMYYGDAYFNLGLAYSLEAHQCGDRRKSSGLVEKAAEYFYKASHVYPDTRHHGEFIEGLKALKGHDFGRALGLFKGVREARRELRRQEYLSLHKRVLTHPEAWTEDVIAGQIRSLEAQLKEHPTYLDLQTELVRCYLERARLIWNQAIVVCEKVIEIRPDAKQIEETRESAQGTLEQMSSTVETVTGRG